MKENVTKNNSVQTWVFSLLLLLVLLIFVAVMWIGVRNEHRKQDQVQKLASSLSLLQQQMAHSENQISEQALSITGLQQTIRTLQIGGHSEAVALLNARELVSLGHFSMLLGDVDAAEHALVSAQQQINTIQNIDLSDVKQSLQDDLNSLKQWEVNTTTSEMIAKIDALYQSLDTISLSSVQSEFQKTDAAPQTTWEKFLSNMQQYFHSDRESVAMTPEEFSALKTIIGLKLMQAETALIQKNNAWFTQDLNFIQTTMSHSYFSKDTAMQNWLQMFNDLSKTDLSVQVPSFESTIQMIDAHLTTLSSRANQAENAIVSFPAQTENTKKPVSPAQQAIIQQPKVSTVKSMEA